MLSVTLDTKLLWVLGEIYNHLLYIDILSKNRKCTLCNSGATEDEHRSISAIPYSGPFSPKVAVIKRCLCII